MKEKKYYPDSIYHLINIVWNFIVYTIALAGTAVLVSINKYDLKFLSASLLVLMAWFNILFSQFSIRRLDKKYLDRLLTDSRVGSFIVIPLLFSSKTLLKLKWMRASIYLFYYNRWPSLQKLRKEIIPEFNYKKDIKFYDKFFYWGQYISILLCAVFGFMAKW